MDAVVKLDNQYNNQLSRNTGLIQLKYLINFFFVFLNQQLFVNKMSIKQWEKEMFVE